MTDQPDLLKAIRTGNLDGVRTALDSDPALGSPGLAELAMGMACFLGHADIVRVLFVRGFGINLPDNTVPTSPLKMAIRGGRKEVVRLLVELGLVIPAGVQCGLTAQEITVAQWIAFRDGFGAQGEHAAEPLAEPAIEEIIVKSLNGVDTQVLESDALRAALRGE
jgi:ankyrin repeat protein